jgi:hypothetical protein
MTLCSVARRPPAQTERAYAFAGNAGGAELLHPPDGLFKSVNNAREDSPDRQRLRSEIDALAAGVSVQG